MSHIEEHLKKHFAFHAAHPNAVSFCIHWVMGNKGPKFCGQDVTNTGVCPTHGMDMSATREQRELLDKLNKD